MKISDLTAKLQQESNETAERAKEISLNALSKFESDLTQQFSSAIAILRNDLELRREELMDDLNSSFARTRTSLSETSNEMEKQLATLKAEVAKWAPTQTRAMKMGVLIPIGVVLAACGLIVLGTLIWMPRELWNIQTSHTTMTDGRKYLVIDDPSWTNCNLTTDPKQPKLMRPCKAIDQPNSNP